MSNKIATGMTLESIMPCFDGFLEVGDMWLDRMESGEWCVYVEFMRFDKTGYPRGTQVFRVDQVLKYLNEKVLTIIDVEDDDDEDEDGGNMFLVTVPQAFRNEMMMKLSGRGDTIHDRGYTDGSTSYAFLVESSAETADELEALLECHHWISVVPYDEDTDVYKCGE